MKYMHLIKDIETEMKDVNPMTVYIKWKQDNNIGCPVEGCVRKSG